MKRTTSIGAISAVALAAAGYVYLTREPSSLPPTMQPDGKASNNGIIIKRKTIDWETVIKTALADKASFLTMTVTETRVHDQELETSIRFMPFPASRARVRVKYEAEYPIGYVLLPGRFAVSGGVDGLVVTLHRPRLIARPSVRLLSHDILESGILVDEKAALLELQQRIEPEAERRSAEILARADVIPRSERALRDFLKPFLSQAADGAAPPAITFEYR